MRNILITGGSLINKGAQAMVYVTVCEMRKRFPDKRILVVMNKTGIPEGVNINNFKFEIIDPKELGIDDLFCFDGLRRIKIRIKAILRFFNLKKQYRKIQLWKNTDYVMDISGFVIGKKWGMQKSCREARKAAVAKRYGAKCIFLPQSFGPFDFTGMSEHNLKKGHRLLKKWLGCATVIYAREESGKKMLEETYGLTNVKLAQDIVLQNRGYELQEIYKIPPKKREVEIKEKSVALIPNIHVMNNKSNDVYALWEAAVKELLKRSYHVYLLVHDISDFKIIQEIKNRYKDEERVVLLQDDFACEEFDQIVNKFDFLIASRYHAIVHAYRNAVPCVVLGWADKYAELLGWVNQQEFGLDLRKKVEARELIEKVQKMDSDKAISTSEIHKNVEKIQRNSVFAEMDKYWA